LDYNFVINELNPELDFVVVAAVVVVAAAAAVVINLKHLKLLDFAISQVQNQHLLMHLIVVAVAAVVVVVAAAAVVEIAVVDFDLT